MSLFDPINGFLVDVGYVDPMDREDYELARSVGDIERAHERREAEEDAARDRREMRYA